MNDVDSCVVKLVSINLENVLGSGLYPISATIFTDRWSDQLLGWHIKAFLHW